MGPSLITSTLHETQATQHRSTKYSNNLPSHPKTRTMPSVYLVSGANRGIGLGFVRNLIARPDTVVFAGSRDPLNKDLQSLVTTYPDRFFSIALDSADEALNKAAASFIEEKAGKLDVVIANAGKGNASTILEADPADFADTFRVNVLGPLVLFQNTQHLLRKSTQTGRFIIITSAQGSIAGMIPGPSGGYSVTKAAVNSLAVKIQEENQDLIAVSICPGFIKTEGAMNFVAQMGPSDVDYSGLASSVEDGVVVILDHIHEIEKVNNPTTFWSALGPREIPF